MSYFRLCKKKHGVETVELLLWVALTYHQPQRYTKPHLIPTNFFSQDVYISFGHQDLKNLQNQCGAINLLHGSNLCGVGVPIFQTQRSGCPRLFSGPTICDLSEIIPPPGQFQPLPITILHFLCSIFQGSSTRDQSFYDLKWISFFFLLQSRE